MQELAGTGDGKARLNPLRSAERAKALITNKLDDCRKAAREGRLIAWGSGPTELLQTMGIPCVRLGHLAQHARRAGVDRLLREVAEREGFPEESCSNTITAIGLALLMKRGEVDRIPEVLRVPRPQFVMSGGECWLQVQRGRVLGEIFKVPALVLDMPFFHQPDLWEQNMRYVTGQLQDFVAFLEEMTGRPYNWDGLKELTRSYRNLNHFRNAFDEANKNIPALVDMMDRQLCGTTFDARVDPDTLLQFWQEIDAELQERVAGGISAVSPEKCRILWVGIPFRGEEKNLSRMFGERGAVVVAGSCTDRPYGVYDATEMPPDGIDIDRPLFTLAAANCHWGTRALDWKMDQAVYRYADGYSLDGVVLFSSYTCRPWGIGAFDMRDEVERKLGIPALVLEGDHMDSRRFAIAELEDRVQAFIEVVLLKKEERLRPGGGCHA